MRIRMKTRSRLTQWVGLGLWVAGLWGCDDTESAVSCGAGTVEQEGQCVALQGDTGSPSPTSDAHVLAVDAAVEAPDFGVDGGGSPDAMPPPSPPPTDWCARIVSGPVGQEEIPLALSAAHGQIRFFGAHLGYVMMDELLAGALRGEDSPMTPDLDAYAAGSTAVCALDAEVRRVLDPVTIEQVDDVAIVRPGIGPVEIPDEVSTIVIDLRDLPATPDLSEALETALAAALTDPLHWPTRRVRRHNGMFDEVFAPSIGTENMYAMETADLERSPWPGTAHRARALVLWTDVKMPPLAAELAGALRLTGRAWLLGPGVRAEVAEAQWAAIDERGLAWRAADLIWNGRRWPDAIPGDDLEVSLEATRALVAQDRPASVPQSADDRPAVAVFDPIAETHPTTLHLGRARAALLVAHGASSRFFSNIESAQDELDALLVETLASTTAEQGTDREHLTLQLGRLSYALHDGHSWVQDTAPDHTSRFVDMAGWALMDLDAADPLPLVTRTDEPELAVGDAILAIDGVAIETFLAEIMRYVSAATPGNHRLQSIYLLTILKGPTRFTIEAPTGDQREVELTPSTGPAARAFYDAAPVRRSGWLDERGADGSEFGDLEADNLYYINMDVASLSNGTQQMAALDDALDADGIVLDMRGYPATGITLNHITDRLLGSAHDSPLFHIPTWTGPNQLEWVAASYRSAGPGRWATYEGPVVLLVGPGTQSAAEDFCIPLVAAHRVTVLGRQSSGTDGNITGLKLPGGFSLTFTGLDVRFPDGSLFHGVGIVPDHEIAVEAADLAAGIDRALVSAIETLRRQIGR